MGVFKVSPCGIRVNRIRGSSGAGNVLVEVADDIQVSCNGANVICGEDYLTGQFALEAKAVCLRVRHGRLRIHCMNMQCWLERWRRGIGGVQQTGWETILELKCGQR